MIVVSGANVLLLDEPTNNLDPASRAEILGALANYAGAVVLVSHDEGAVKSLNPERVLILPDGVEDYWNRDYADLGGAGLSRVRLIDEVVLDVGIGAALRGCGASGSRSSVRTAKPRPTKPSSAKRNHWNA